MQFKKQILQAWRQSTRQKQLSILQLIGIVIGVAASLLLCNYVNWHYSFDRFHHDLDQLYRVSSLQREGDAMETNALSPAGLGPGITGQLPGILMYTRVAQWIANDVVLSHGKQVIRDDQFIFAESSFFKFFSFEITSGSPQALKRPNTILLTQSKALALFGNTNVIGEEVLFENFKPLSVAGIVEDPPANSHLQFSSIISFRTLQDWGFEVFGDNELDIPYVYSYLKLEKATDPDLQGNLITSLVEKSSNAEKTAENVSFTLRPLAKLHLSSSDEINDLAGTNPVRGIWFLFAISILILIISWVNHLNIFGTCIMRQETSLSVRKILGATSAQIFQTIFVHSFFMNFLGIITGIIVALIAKPSLFPYLNIPVHQGIFSWLQWKPGIILTSVILVGSILFSLFPAFWITARHTNALQLQTQDFKSKGIRVRLILVGIQFAIILTLMTGGIVGYQQMQYIHQKDPGFNLDRVLSIRSPLGFDPEQFEKTYPAFKQFLLSNPSITNVGFSRNIPGNALEYTGQANIDGKKFPFGLSRNFIAPDFIPVYELPVIVKLDRTLLDNNRYAYVNRKVVDLLGLRDPLDILNKTINIYGWEVVIIGVTENFHQQSFHHPITPIMMDFTNISEASVDGYISIKYKSNPSVKVINDWVKDAFYDFFPLTVFESTEVKESYYNLYSWDQNFQIVSMIFTVIALVIGCLGLLALSLLLIQQRLKEVSIRKVLGASTQNIILLFARDFIIVILLAIPVASILANYLLHIWMNNYAYHVEISWWVFVLAGIITLLIGFFTIGIQSRWVAKIDPVEQLRNSL
ncbi:MAG: ABC transporter permease [Saprospiraceae bacterium]|nr:ABC transporter permease [Saprospiraceae bacterium]